MALPNGAGGYQVGAGNRQETIMGAMGAPQTATATATLTAAQIANQMLVANPSTSAATYTLPLLFLTLLLAAILTWQLSTLARLLVR
jgi:hypothetical protein